MKSLEIVKEELKELGLDVAEETVMEVIKAIGKKILPRIAAEEDNAIIKGAMLIAIPAFAAIKPSLIQLADKIDGEDDV